MPDKVNAQITDAVNTVNAILAGNSPEIALSFQRTATSQALSTAAHNGTTAQQQGDVVALAVATQGAAQILQTKI